MLAKVVGLLAKLLFGVVDSEDLCLIVVFLDKVVDDDVFVVMDKIAIHDIVVVDGLVSVVVDIVVVVVVVVGDLIDVDKLLLLAVEHCDVGSVDSCNFDGVVVFANGSCSNCKD